MDDSGHALTQVEFRKDQLLAQDVVLCLPVVVSLEGSVVVSLEVLVDFAQQHATNAEDQTTTLVIVRRKL